MKQPEWAAMLAAVVLAAPAHADVCDKAAAAIRAVAPQEMAHRWPGREQAMKIYDRDGPAPFSTGDGEALLKDLKAWGGDDDLIDDWTSLLSADADTHNAYSNSVYLLKSAGVGYLDNDNGGTAHCQTLSLFYYDAGGHARLVRGDGKGFRADPCYDNGGHLLRLGGDIAWLYEAPAETTPAEDVWVYRWQAHNMVRVCHIATVYDYVYTPGAGGFGGDPDKGNPFETYMLANMAPWAAVYRAWYDQPYASRTDTVQKKLLADFAAAHPQMMPAIDFIRKGADRGDSNVDFPVDYAGQAAVVRIEQGWYSTAQRHIQLMFLGIKGGKSASLGGFYADATATALRSLTVTRSDRPSG